MFNKSAKLTTKEWTPIPLLSPKKHTHQNYETHKTTSHLICFSSKIENSTNIMFNQVSKTYHKRTPLPLFCPRYNIMWSNLSVTCDSRQVGGFLQVLLFLPQIKRYNWNIVESGVKHHKPDPYLTENYEAHIYTMYFIYFFF